MAAVTAQQMETWFGDNCNIGEGTAVWNQTWATVGLNDTDPPDPPSPPVSPYVEKAIWIDYQVRNFDGEVPAGWPN